MFTYAAFIQELRSLVERSGPLVDHPEGADSEAFRQWRHEACELIIRINEHKYTINCGVVHRNFGSRGWYRNDAEKTAAFRRDLADTINELNTLVSYFARYGDPKAGEEHLKSNASSMATRQTSKVALQVPEKVTFAWLFQNAPISLWLSGAGLLFCAFCFGITLGRSVMFEEIVSKINSPARSVIVTPMPQQPK
jgi:hypothetical protein